MQKVKVHRYISGKRPDYAPDSSSEEESDHEDFIQTQKIKKYAKSCWKLQLLDTNSNTLLNGNRSKDEEMERVPIMAVQDRRLERLKRTEEKSDEEEEEEEDDEDDIAARRMRRR